MAKLEMEFVQILSCVVPQPDTVELAKPIVATTVRLRLRQHRIPQRQPRPSHRVTWDPFRFQAMPMGFVLVVLIVS
jgi:hypothetical protein